MSNSIIISSKTEIFITGQINKIIEQITCFPGDILKITVEPDKSSIGIKKMAELKKWSMIKPFNSKNKLAIIEQAHLLTTEAQNSILKLLEEPQTDTYIVMITDNYQQLLTTIISRCTLIKDNSQEQGYTTPESEQFFEMSLFERFAYIEKIDKETDKKTALNQFLRLLLDNFRDQLLQTKDRSIIPKLLLISETKKMINAKVSTRNALENLIIQLD